VQTELFPDEQSALERSAQTLKDGIASLKEAETA